MEDRTRAFSPPYLPWKTFFNFLEKLADEGAPDRIDRSFLKSMDGQTQSYLMAALKGFGLMTDEGRVEEGLGSLVSRDTRQQAVRQLLQRHYGQMVGLPTNATQAQLDETFRPYQLGADAMRKAQTFYLRAASYAELPLSPHFKNPASAPGEGGARTGKPRAPRKRQPRQIVQDPPVTPLPPPEPNKGGTSVPTSVHMMLAGPIAWLAENGTGWTDAQATDWLDAFGKQVRLVYPTSRNRQPPAKPASPKTPEPKAEVDEDPEWLKEAGSG